MVLSRKAYYEPSNMDNMPWPHKATHPFALLVPGRVVLALRGQEYTWLAQELSWPPHGHKEGTTWAGQVNYYYKLGEGRCEISTIVMANTF